MPALQREATWAEESLLGDLRQSVPQNGRVHLQIVEFVWVDKTVLGQASGYGTTSGRTSGQGQTNYIERYDTLRHAAVP